MKNVLHIQFDLKNDRVYFIDHFILHPKEKSFSNIRIRERCLRIFTVTKQVIYKTFQC